MTFIFQVSPMMIKLRLRTLASHPETPRSQRFESPSKLPDGSWNRQTCKPTCWNIDIAM